MTSNSPWVLTVVVMVVEVVVVVVEVVVEVVEVVVGVVILLWVVVVCGSLGGRLDHWDKEAVLLACLLACRPSNMLVYLRDGSTQTVARAATLR